MINSTALLIGLIMVVCVGGLMYLAKKTKK